MEEHVHLKKARIQDVTTIHKIINENAREGVMLPRSFQELYENMRDFYIAEDEAREVVGCCALHISWADLGEVKSLAVSGEYRKKGVGRLLVEQCIDEARALGIPKVFALTMVPEFFEKMGFSPIDKNDLPHKVWSECVRCPYFPDCPEQAFLMVVQ